MNITIRADGGQSVGWGHLGRCGALAQALDARGAHVHWACRADEAVYRLTGTPPALTLPGQPTLSTLPTSEAELLGRFSAHHDWIVIDHYGATPGYLATLRQHSTARILLLDDHQVREGADLRLAPNQRPRRDTLSGLAYQLVRPCYLEVAEQARPRDGWIVALGGADPHDRLRASLIELCQGTNLTPSRLTVVASESLQRRQALSDLLSASAFEVSCHAWLEPRELARHFATHEAALVSSSTLAFEALATSTPIVAVVTAENQIELARHLSSMGVPVFDDPVEGAKTLANGDAASQRVDAAFDGRGVWRVADALGVSSVVHSP